MRLQNVLVTIAFGLLGATAVVRLVLAGMVGTLLAGTFVWLASTLLLTSGLMAATWWVSLHRPPVMRYPRKLPFDAAVAVEPTETRRAA